MHDIVHKYTSHAKCIVQFGGVWFSHAVTRPDLLTHQSLATVAKHIIKCSEIIPIHMYGKDH